MLFIPFPFSHMFNNGSVGRHMFPHTEVCPSPLHCNSTSSFIVYRTRVSMACADYIYLAYAISILPALAHYRYVTWIPRRSVRYPLAA